MIRVPLLAVAAVALAGPALAQASHAGHAPPPPADPHAAHSTPAAAKDAHAGHGATEADPHAGHAMPAVPDDPHAGHAMSAGAPDPHVGDRPAPTDPHAGHARPTSADPHAGHAMPPAPAAPHGGHAGASEPVDPHAGHATPAPPADPHAGHDMSAMAPPAGNAPPPPAPTDHAAERFYSAADMAAARAQLAREHGGGSAWRVMLNTAEVRPDRSGDSFAWGGEAWFGNDRHRLVLKSEGEGDVDGDLHAAEVQALYSRPIGPYFDVQVGLRHDAEPGPSRTYATLAFEGLAPYWFELEGAAFLSEEGDLSARFEGAYDLRLTQKLILEPRAEINLAAQEVPELGLGAGFTDLEVGLRLRYEFRRELAPYIGIHHERKFGDTADLARAQGEGVRDTRFVIGLRAWF